MTRVVSRLDDQSCNESLLSLQRLVVEQDMLFRAYIISGLDTVGILHHVR